MSIIVNQCMDFFYTQNFKAKGVNWIELKALDRLFYKALGRKLALIRNCKGINLKEIGEELHCSTQMIDNFELGKNRISEDKFVKYCNYLDVNPNLEIKVNFKKE